MRYLDYLSYFGILIFLFFFVTNTFGKIKESDWVAVVNGEPITVKEVLYVAGIEHRREDLPKKAKKIDLYQFLEKVIQDNLIFQEAKNIGLETDPWYQAKVNNYIITMAVRKLYEDEILSKLKPTQKMLQDFYKRNFHTYKILYFQNKDKIETEKARTKLLQNQGNFTIGEYTKVSLLNDEEIWKNVKDLKPGQVSQVFKYKNNYMVIKILEIKPPDMKDFNRRRKSIENAWEYYEKKRLEKIKLEDLKKKYQSEIVVYKDKIKKFNNKIACQNKNLNEILAKVRKFELSAQELCNSLNRNPHLDAEEYVSQWIDFRVVEVEALSRKYHLKDPLKEDIKNYKKQLLKRIFIEKIVAPNIKITDNDLREYYERHKEKFREENSYKIGRIIVDDHQTALKLLSELDTGADFYFLAEKYAKNEEIRKTKGVMGWMKESIIPEHYKKAFQKLEREEIGMTKDGPHWSILKILDVKKGGVKSFNTVKEFVESEVWNEKVEKVLNDYVKKLKKDAKIVIYHDKIRKLEKSLFQ